MSVIFFFNCWGTAGFLEGWSEIILRFIVKSMGGGQQGLEGWAPLRFPIQQKSEEYLGQRAGTAGRRQFQFQRLRHKCRCLGVEGPHSR